MLAAGVLVVCSILQAADEVGKGIVVDKEKRTITIDAKMAPRKIDDERYKGIIYPIEVIACWGFPKGEKAHETVVTIDGVKPSDVHKALESLGLKPGKPVYGESKEPPQGPAVNVYLEFPGPDNEPKRVPIEKCLMEPKSEKPMPRVQWRFTGSSPFKPDPTKDETIYGADHSGTLLSIFPVTDLTVFQTNLTMKEEKFLKLETDPKVVPKIGTPVKLVLEIAAK
jgi:hypothetical protein